MTDSDYGRRLSILESKMDEVRDELAELREWRRGQERRETWTIRLHIAVLAAVLAELARALIR